MNIKNIIEDWDRWLCRKATRRRVKEIAELHAAGVKTYVRFPDGFGPEGEWELSRFHWHGPPRYSRPEAGWYDATRPHKIQLASLGPNGIEHEEVDGEMHCCITAYWVCKHGTMVNPAQSVEEAMKCNSQKT